MNILTEPTFLFCLSPIVMFLEMKSLFFVFKLPYTTINSASSLFNATFDKLHSLIAFPNLLKNDKGKFLYSSFANYQLLQLSLVFTWKSYSILKSIFYYYFLIILICWKYSFLDIFEINKRIFKSLNKIHLSYELTIFLKYHSNG